MMQPENDTQAVRRVLARAGITAAALTLTFGPAAPALAHGGGAAADRSGSHRADAQRTDGQSTSGQSTDSHSTSGQSSSGQSSSGQSTSGQSTDSHSTSGQSTSGRSEGAAHSKSGDHGATGGNGASSQDPAGNNGTVKIHDVAGDLSHHNVPHVDCDFWVPMWGFDAGQSMTVSFAGQAPTGKDQPVTFTAPDGYTLTSTTPAGGGNDYDGELGFSTTAESLQSQLGAPQPQQGYHVKMTVSTGAPGGYKYKVFWINCPATTGGGGELGGGGQLGGGGGQLGGGSGELGGGGQLGGGGGAGATVAGESAGQGQVGTAVLGEKVTRATTGTSATAATAAAPGAGSLPFTGAEIGGLAAAGAAALGGGAFLTVAGRRRRRVGGHRA
ncbi:MAG TPA: hypothetical protein VFH66_10850 [Mycobacteriales bacterium]|nr:hypothetical protein [Mycobacteriales bacterium]